MFAGFYDYVFGANAAETANENIETAADDGQSSSLDRNWESDWLVVDGAKASSGNFVMVPMKDIEAIDDLNLNDEVATETKLVRPSPTKNELLRDRQRKEGKARKARQMALEMAMFGGVEEKNRVTGAAAKRLSFSNRQHVSQKGAQRSARQGDLMSGRSNCRKVNVLHDLKSLVE